MNIIESTLSYAHNKGSKEMVDILLKNKETAKYEKTSMGIQITKLGNELRDTNHKLKDKEDECDRLKVSIKL